MCVSSQARSNCVLALSKITPSEVYCPRRRRRQQWAQQQNGAPPQLFLPFLNTTLIDCHLAWLPEDGHSYPKLHNTEVLSLFFQPSFGYCYEGSLTITVLLPTWLAEFPLQSWLLKLSHSSWNLCARSNCLNIHEGVEVKGWMIEWCTSLDQMGLSRIGCVKRNVVLSRTKNSYLSVLIHCWSWCCWNSLTLPGTFAPEVIAQTYMKAWR